MSWSLRRRVEKLEARYGNGQKKFRQLAARLKVDPERMLQAVKNHEAELLVEMGDGPGITWEGFQFLYELLYPESDP
jgi:hypothetical protein